MCKHLKYMIFLCIYLQFFLCHDRVSLNTILNLPFQLNLIDCPKLAKFHQILFGRNNNSIFCSSLLVILGKNKSLLFFYSKLSDKPIMVYWSIFVILTPCSNSASCFFRISASNALCLHCLTYL